MTMHQLREKSKKSAYAVDFATNKEAHKEGDRGKTPSLKYPGPTPIHKAL